MIENGVENSLTAAAIDLAVGGDVGLARVRSRTYQTLPAKLLQIYVQGAGARPENWPSVAHAGVLAGNGYDSIAVKRLWHNALKVTGE